LKSESIVPIGIRSVLLILTPGDFDLSRSPILQCFVILAAWSNMNPACQKGGEVRRD